MRSQELNQNEVENLALFQRVFTPWPEITSAETTISVVFRSTRCSAISSGETERGKNSENVPFSRNF